MYQMTQKDIKPIREKLHRKNKGLCPILKIPLLPKDSALDHAHQSSKVSDTVEGQIRSTIHKYANSLEGSMRSKYLRSGVAKYISFEHFLYNLWLYLMEYREPLLHPSHAPKPRKLMKKSYNNLKREIQKYNQYTKKPIKIPFYPKSKRLTKRLKELYEEFGMFPEYYNE
jgi:hypothetical protein